MHIFRVATALIVSLLSQFAWADTSKQDAIKLLNDAMALKKKAGMEALISGIKQNDPKFTRPGAYLSVLELDGDCLADGSNWSLVGTNLLTMKDSSGTTYFRDGIESAKTKNMNWRAYKLENPVTHSMESREFFAVQHSGLVFFVTIIGGG